jgi:hypothetical protein
MNDDDIEQIQEAESDSMASDHPRNNSRSTSQDVSPARENEDPSSFKPPRVRTSSMSLVPATTSARAPEVKEGRKYNALKHGIFSKAVVLKNESQDEYNSLLAGLVEYFQPQQAMEEVLVENLSVLIWRHRRLIKAEAAEIRMSTEFLEWDEKTKEQKDVEEMESNRFRLLQGGLIRHKENPLVLKKCLELLGVLRQGVKDEGFGYELADEILLRLYGASEDERLERTLLESYQAWKATSTVSEEERKLNGYASQTKCKDNALQEINDEIRGLKKYQKDRAPIESHRIELEILRRGIPDAHRLDRLLRYEASLEPAFDRTLIQLERLQRVRRGQPLPPQVDVNLRT